MLRRIYRFSAGIIFHLQEKTIRRYDDILINMINDPVINLIIDYRIEYED